MSSPTISDFVPELVCLGVDCLVCGIVYTTYVLTNRAISSVCAAPSINLDTKPHDDVESLRDQIRSHPNTKINQEGETCIPYAIIRGNIEPASKSIQSEYHNDDTSLSNRKLEGVLRQFALTEHKRKLSRTGFWHDSTRVLHEYTNHVPFYIVPEGLATKGLFTSKLSNANCKKAEVLDWAEAAILDLDVTKDSFEAAPSSLGDNVWGWWVGDKTKGIQTTEKMLLNGTTLTAIGELAISKQTGNIKIQAPSSGENYYLVKATSKALIKDLEGNARILRYTLFFLGGVGAVILSIAACRYYIRVKATRESQRLRRELDEIIQGRTQRNSRNHNTGAISQNATDEENITDPSDSQAHNRSDENSESSGISAQICVVCLSEQREVILMNCGHVCVCAECAMQIMSTRPVCPVCRANIDQVAPAYIV